MKQKRSLLDYFGASPTPSKRKQRDESSTTSGNVQSSTAATASSEYVSHASCSSTAHTSTNTDDTVASESSTEFMQSVYKYCNVHVYDLSQGKRVALGCTCGR